MRCWLLGNAQNKGIACPEQLLSTVTENRRCNQIPSWMVNKHVGNILFTNTLVELETHKEKKPHKIKINYVTTH